MNRALTAIRLLIKSAFSNETRHERFRRYALTNRWRNRETISGPGSTIEYTENLRAELPRVLKRFDIKTMLDAPCGDYNWMQQVERPGVQYIGGEIVPEIVEDNNERYADENTRFIVCDIVEDSLPAADLWVCRDVLFHFPYDDIWRTLRNLFRSDITYILTTDHPEQSQNVDIGIGAFRPLNMMREPFCFPEPILWIDDWIDGYPVRRMGLWHVRELESAVVGNPSRQKAVT